MKLCGTRTSLGHSSRSKAQSFSLFKQAMSNSPIPSTGNLDSAYCITGLLRSHLFQRKFRRTNFLHFTVVMEVAKSVQESFVGPGQIQIYIQSFEHLLICRRKIAKRSSAHSHFSLHSDDDLLVRRDGWVAFLRLPQSFSGLSIVQFHRVAATGESRIRSVRKV